MAAQDHHDTQMWKEHPRTANLVSWCIRQSKARITSVYGTSSTKLQNPGVNILQEMLQNVPVEISDELGLTGCFSLNTCLGQLQDERTPRLLQAVVPMTVRLVEMTTPQGSNQTFEQLCTLLGEGIIGTVWVYSPDSQETILASVESLSVVVRALGIGALRYLPFPAKRTDKLSQALIPQLTHPLYANEFQKTSRELQAASLRALRVVLEECAPRIEMWKGTILDAIARCWVESAGTIRLDFLVSLLFASYRLELRTELQITFLALVNACPMNYVGYGPWTWRPFTREEQLLCLLGHIDGRSDEIIYDASPIANSRNMDVDRNVEMELSQVSHEDSSYLRTISGTLLYRVSAASTSTSFTTMRAKALLVTVTTTETSPATTHVTGTTVTSTTTSALRPSSQFSLMTFLRPTSMPGFHQKQCSDTKTSSKPS
ncbi:hypothetical protein C8J56DRAFT_1048685 [Mycena floridula]|nr:hypothetical protein C8J56DRAFT_1048685 [Mycena floridula]